MNRHGLPDAVGQKSIRTKLMRPISVAALGVLTATGAILWQSRKSGTEQCGLTAAKIAADQVLTLRSFYTSEIAARALRSGLSVNYDFDRKEKTLPLPATLVKALGDQIARDHPGTRLRLYSRFPFPHRAATERYDDFERQALDQLERAPDRPFARFEVVDGRLSARYAVADVMMQACVDCHNNHPESPKRDWHVGDVRGVVEVVVPVDQVDSQLGLGILLTGSAIVAGFVALSSSTFRCPRSAASRRRARSWPALPVRS